MPLQLTAINRYPVKSCRGEALSEAVVEPWGLAGDRRWMVVDGDNNAVTAREFPQLLFVRPQIVPDGIRLQAPGMAHIVVRRPNGPASTVTLFHRRPFPAAFADTAAHEWVSAVVGRPCTFVYHDNPDGRPTNAEFSNPGDRVSLADGYPVLVTTEESLATLNTLIDDGPRGDEGPLPMTRFRPNIVVSGAEPWVEDGWRLVQVGEARFRAVKGCDRCVLTTIDPDSGRKGKEPIATLARHRKWDGATWFGMNLIPDTPGATIRVGDRVDVLEAVPHPDGPPR